MGKILDKNPLFKWFLKVFITFMFLFLLFRYGLMNIEVPSASMEPTLKIGHYYICDRASYIIKKPERFDIAVFNAPDSGELYVKRIIGLPGEKVEIKDGKVYIDNKKLDDIKAEEMHSDDAVYIVPEDSYFMLGDNRNDSDDSRFWNNHFVSKEKIESKVWFQYSPKLEKIK